MTVHDDGQPAAAGPFSWRRRPRVVLREWTTTPAFDLVDADSNAYAHLAQPVTHRRRVIFVKPDFWVLIDDLTGSGRHHIDLTFQFAPLRVELTAPDCCRAETARGSVLWIMPFCSTPLTNAVRSGDVKPIRGWISNRYGHKQPSPALVCSATAALPMRAMTVLYPMRDRQACAPLAGALYQHGSLTGVQVGGHTIHLHDDRVVLQQN